MTDSDDIRAVRGEVDRLRTALERVERRLVALELQASREGASGEQEAPSVAPPRLTPPPLPGTAALVRLPEEVSGRAYPSRGLIKTAAPVRAVPAGPSLLEQIQALLKRLGPKEEMSWEMALGTYWMPRVAMMIIALGLVWGATYVSTTYADARWMPYVRLGAGFALSLGLLLAGFQLEARYRGYARVLMGGGMGMLYFMTFCMHYVPYTRVIDRAEPVLLLLGLLVASWAVAAHRRRSPILACVMILAGQFTVGLSTLTLEAPSRFGAGGIVALAVLGAASMLVHRWFVVAAVAMVSSYTNHFFWLVQSPGSDAPLDFAVAMAILLGYWVLFAGSELLAPEGLRRRVVAMRWRNAFVSFNTAAYVFMGAMLTESFDFSRPHDHVFWWLSGALLLGTGALYRWRRKGDPLQHIYVLKASAVIAVGLALYFDGPSLSLSLAVEALVLLAGARILGLPVSRLASLALMGLVGLHGLGTVADTQPIAYGDPAYWPVLVPAILLTLAFFVYSEVYRTGVFAPAASTGRDARRRFPALQVQLELMAPVSSGERMPLARLAGEYVSATLGMLLLGLHLNLLFDDRHAMLPFALPVLALGGYAALRGAAPLGFTALWGALLALNASFGGVDAGAPWSILAPTGVTLALHSFWAETRYWGARPGLRWFQRGGGPYLAYAVPVLFLVNFVRVQFTGHQEVALLLAAAILFHGLASVLHPRALAGWGIATYCYGALVWSSTRPEMGLFGWHATSVWIIVLGFCGDRYLAVARIFPRVWGNAILLGVALLAGMGYAVRWLEDGYFLAGWALLALIYLAYAGIFRHRVAAVLSVCLATLGTAMFLPFKGTGVLAVWLPGAGYVLYWILIERGAAWWLRTRGQTAPELLRKQPVSGLSAGIVVVLLIAMTANTPTLGSFYLTISWTVCALLLIGLSLAVGQPHYRYGGLALFGLAILRVVFVDSRELQGIYRVAGAIVLGLTLLALAYGYVWVRAHQTAPAQTAEADQTK